MRFSQSTHLQMYLYLESLGLVNLFLRTGQSILAELIVLVNSFILNNFRSRSRFELMYKSLTVISRSGLIHGFQLPVMKPWLREINSFVCTNRISLLHLTWSSNKLQSWTKWSGQSKKIKKNWAEVEKLDNCFCVIFDHYYESFIFRTKTEH